MTGAIMGGAVVAPPPRAAGLHAICTKNCERAQNAARKLTRKALILLASFIGRIVAVSARSMA